MVKIKYRGDQTTGQPLKKGETRTVVVTGEVITTPSGDEYGFEGEIVIYTANVLDNLSNTIPAAFEVDLRVNGTPIIQNQVFNETVYDDETGDLTLEFIVPDDTTLPVGEYTIKLKWNTQIINVI